MTYRLSRKAEDDVIEIYVAGVVAFGVAQAERYHEGLERTFGLLADFPLVAPERAELRGAPRVHPHKSHIIIYRLDGADILILRVTRARIGSEERSEAEQRSRLTP